MTAILTQITGLNGMDITPYVDMYSEKDVGRFGKAIQNLIDDNFPHVLGNTNYGNGPDIEEFPGCQHGIDIKSILQDRKPSSLTTIVSMSEHYGDYLFDDLPQHIKDKILADRLWVEHNKKVVTSHTFVYNDEWQRDKLINAWNDLARNRSNYKGSYVRSNYVVEYKKEKDTICWRQRNKLLDQTIRTLSDRNFKHRFNDMFDVV